MIQFVWPWLFLLLPLPLLARRWLPPARTGYDYALRVPFFALLTELAPRRGSEGVPWRRLLPALLIWSLLLTAAARPYWMGNAGPLPITGRDLMLVVDISGSMRERDFALLGEPADRLQVVKRVAGEFIKRRKGDRLGLILFGAQPYLRAPLSHDHITVGELLEETEIALAGEYTAIGDAVGLALKRMRELHSDSRVIILLSDGANNEGQLGPQQAARLAAAEGIRIYTIGLGEQDVVAPNPYAAWSAEAAADFDRETLLAMATISGGRYFQALDAAGLEAIYRELDSLEPALGDEVQQFMATPLYSWPLGMALLLTLLLAYKRQLHHSRERHDVE